MQRIAIKLYEFKFKTVIKNNRAYRFIFILNPLLSIFYLFNIKLSNRN